MEQQNLKDKNINFFIKKLEIRICIFILLFSESLAIPRWIEIVISSVSYVFIFIIILGRWKRLTYVATTDIFPLLLVVLAAASVLWSENPSSTTYQLKFLLRSTIFGVYLAAQYTPRDQLLLLSWTTGISMILNVALTFLFPSYATIATNGSFGWTGIFGHKQAFGRYMAFTASIFLINYFDKRSNRWFTLVGLGIALVLVLLSNSKTSLIIFLFSLALMPLYKITQQRKYRGFMLFATFIIFSTIAAVITINLETIVVDILGKNFEFNGRTPVWTLAIEQGLQRPWLGYGYNGFWTSDISDYIIQHSWASEDFNDRSVLIFHSHNGFIDQFLQLGLIGIVLFFVNLFMLLKRIIYLNVSTRKIEYFWMLQFIGIFLLDNLSNGLTILGVNNIFWILYLSIVFSSAIECRHINKKRYFNCLSSSEHFQKSSHNSVI